MKVLLSLMFLSLALAAYDENCNQTILKAEFIDGVITEPEGCVDVYDNIKHQFGTRWNTAKCMRCSCNHGVMECCTRYIGIARVPGCVAVLNQDTCRHTFHEPGASTHTVSAGTTCPSASASQAMLILSCPSKLRLLEEMLRKTLPQALAVCGAVININRGNPVGYEVIVDSWPEFKAILTRPHREVASDDLDIYANAYAAFYRDHNAYRTLLLESDAVNWAQRFRILGNQGGLYDVSRDAAAAKKMLFSATSYIAYLAPDPNKLTAHELDAGFRISSLNSSHVDLLNEMWPYGGNEQSHRYMASMVKCFPNTCILDTNGHPVSWGLMDPFGAETHGYTLSSHRGKGYSSVIRKAQGMKARAAGYFLYGIVALENLRMQKIQSYLGSQRLSDMFLHCLHAPM